MVFLGKEIIMGKVRMTERSGVADIQESYDFVYDYTYCDECGYFDVNISSKLPLAVDKALVVLILVSYIAAMGILVFFTSEWHLSCLAGLIGVIAFFILGSTGHLKCRKCGNEHISSANVLNYAENDKSVIDVPVKSILKNHIETTRV